MYGVMHEIYISWLGSYIQQMSNATAANIKCIVTWRYVGKKKKISLWPLSMDGVQLPQG